MGSIYGLINLFVAAWFYASAVSVKKRAVMWAAIGAFSFLAFRLLGYSLIVFIQNSLAQANLDGLAGQGSSVIDKSINAISRELIEDGSISIEIFYEFLPLIIALFGVFIIRAKFILGMGCFASLLHRTPLKLGERKPL